MVEYPSRIRQGPPMPAIVFVIDEVEQLHKFRGPHPSPILRSTTQEVVSYFLDKWDVHSRDWEAILTFVGIKTSQIQLNMKQRRCQRPPSSSKFFCCNKVHLCVSI